MCFILPSRCSTCHVFCGLGVIMLQCSLMLHSMFTEAHMQCHRRLFSLHGASLLEIQFITHPYWRKMDHVFMQSRAVLLLSCHPPSLHQLSNLNMKCSGRNLQPVHSNLSWEPGPADVLTSIPMVSDTLNLYSFMEMLLLLNFWSWMRLSSTLRVHALL